MATGSYDAAQDAYRCPQGQALPRRMTKYSTEKGDSRADAAAGNICPVKAMGTSSDHGRIVHRSFSAAYLDMVRGYHSTAS